MVAVAVHPFKSHRGQWDTAPAKEDSQRQELLEAGVQQTATGTERDKKTPQQSVTQSDIDYVFKPSKSSRCAIMAIPETNRIIQENLGRILVTEG